MMTPEQQIAALEKTVEKLQKHIVLLTRRVVALETEQRHIKNRHNVTRSQLSGLEQKVRG